MNHSLAKVEFVVLKTARYKMFLQINVEVKMEGDGS